MPISSTDIKKMAAELGAVLCGIASVDRFSGAPKEYHPCDILPKCRSVIVLAIQFSKESVNDMQAYTNERNRLSEIINKMALELSEKVTGMGFNSVPVYALTPCSLGEDQRFHAQLSLKHAGMLAGLGTIGKNSLLINDRFGNMIWLSAVLTTAELDADPLATYEGCIPECRLCLDKCQVKAMHQEPMSHLTCWCHAFTMDNGAVSVHCNTCRVVCPNYLGVGRE